MGGTRVSVLAAVCLFHCTNEQAIALFSINILEIVE